MEAVLGVLFRTSGSCSRQKLYLCPQPFLSFLPFPVAVRLPECYIPVAAEQEDARPSHQAGTAASAHRKTEGTGTKTHPVVDNWFCWVKRLIDSVCGFMSSLQAPSVDIAELLDSPYIESVKCREHRHKHREREDKENMQNARKSEQEYRCGNSIKKSEHPVTRKDDLREQNKKVQHRNSLDDGRENDFVVPETPRTPRSRRPPTYGGMGSPRTTSAHKVANRMSTPPRSAALGTSADRSESCDGFKFKAVGVKTSWCKVSW